MSWASKLKHCQPSTTPAARKKKLAKTTVPISREKSQTSGAPYISSEISHDEHFIEDIEYIKNVCKESTPWILDKASDMNICDFFYGYLHSIEPETVSSDEDI